MARVPYVEQDDLPEEYQPLIVSALQNKPIHIYRAIGNNPSILAGLREFFSSLWSDTGLSERKRELVILAIAREAGSEYEWHQHVNIGAGAGVTDEEMRAISAGRFDDFDPDEAVLLRYAIAVVNDAVDDALHDDLREYVSDDETIVGLTALAVAYFGVARLLSALDVEIEEEFVGWEPGDH